MTVFGGDGFRMELDAEDGALLVLQSLDRAVVACRRNLQASGKVFGRDHERMIAGRRKGRGCPRTGPCPVANERGLSMHGRRGPDDRAAESPANRLVAQTDAEYRRLVRLWR